MSPLYLNTSEHAGYRGVLGHICDQPYCHTDFCKKFEAISNKFSFDIILLNIEYLQEEIEEYKKRIVAGEIQLIQMMQAQELKDYTEKRDTYLLPFRTEIEKTKNKKWFRDLDDYSKGQVFQWQQPMMTHRFQSKFSNRGKMQYRRPQQKKRWDNFGYTTAESDSADEPTSHDARPFPEKGTMRKTDIREQDAGAVNTDVGTNGMQVRTTRQTTKRAPIVQYLSNIRSWLLQQVPGCQSQLVCDNRAGSGAKNHTFFLSIKFFIVYYFYKKKHVFC